jgi:O-acetyl-ADP-ribose deacetylase
VAPIQLWHGDICDLEVDAIVNAASASLWMSTGVGGAIKHRGGDAIEYEAVRQGPAAVGSAIVTGPGALASRYVIHAVSLGADRRTSAEAIADATRSALRAADERECESVAFPALGTGVGGFPLDEAARIMIETCHAELPACRSVATIIFALKGAATYQAFQAALVGDAATSPVT